MLVFTKQQKHIRKEKDYNLSALEESVRTKSKVGEQLRVWTQSWERERVFDDPDIEIACDLEWKQRAYMLELEETDSYTTKIDE